MSGTAYKLVYSSMDIARVGYECLNDGLSRSYFYDGLLHRDDDEPAYEDFNGTKKWYNYGELHRTLGPAIVSTSNGVTIEIYYLRGKELEGKETEDFKKLISGGITLAPLYINHKLLYEVARDLLEGLE